MNSLVPRLKILLHAQTQLKSVPVFSPAQATPLPCLYMIKLTPLVLKITTEHKYRGFISVAILKKKKKP